MNIPFEEKRRKLQNYGDAVENASIAKTRVDALRIQQAQLKNDVAEAEDYHRRMLAAKDSTERELIRVGLMNTNRELVDAGAVQAAPALCPASVQ